MIRFLASLALVGVSTIAAADPVDDGRAALDSGDYS